MLKLSQPNHDIFVPDGASVEEALARTTFFGVGAHQDDLEFMAYYPILRAYQNAGEWFTGVTVTNGSGSARSGAYEKYSDEKMMQVRRVEQNDAAKIGRYSAMLQLDHPSSAVKDRSNTIVVDDLEKILRVTRPEKIYTHNIADKHKTHVGVVLKLVAAILRLPMNMRPKELIGCPVWRDLDWLCDKDKVVMVVDGDDALADRLMEVYQSQIAGGKRYDEATRGRRRASATYFESYKVDTAKNIIFGMDMTDLINERSITPRELFERYHASFGEEVMSNLEQ